MKSFLKSLLISLLILEARLVLKKYKPFVIAVTGSVGKTSTKDAIYTALRGSGYIRKSEKSFNSEIGVPLTVLGVENAWSDPFLWISNLLKGLELIFFSSAYPQCLVLEVGADHPGDIGRLATWLRPDIAVITKVSEVPVHVEFFPSVEAVLIEKKKLAQAVSPQGVCIFSADGKELEFLKKDISAKILTFGIRNPADIQASDISFTYDEKGNPQGISAMIHVDAIAEKLEVKGVLGEHHIYPLLAALTVAQARGVAFLDALKSLSLHSVPRGRMNILPGIQGTTLIDDTYNSSPDASHEALSTLEKLTVKGKKVAVLGDMMELGKFSAAEHKKVGERANSIASLVVTVGQRARAMTTPDKAFTTLDEASEYLKAHISEGDIVLIKGSQSMRMEKITKALMVSPEKAEELLVRQDAEWLAKE